ncbi:uncharacterized protein [Ptychodera flava]|uniref:uncharacterized protein n=1 Tax=Ptychodera flava TaxID=63121 RepID=UPI00396A6E4A
MQENATLKENITDNEMQGEESQVDDQKSSTTDGRTKEEMIEDKLYTGKERRHTGDGKNDGVSSGNIKASTGRKRRQGEIWTSSNGANNEGYNSSALKNKKQSSNDHDVKKGRKDTEYNTGKQDVKKRRSRDSPFHRLWLKKNKRRRLPCQIEIKVRPDGVIPQEGKTVREVTTAFYSNKQTKENTVLVGKQLDQRHKHMALHDTRKGSISYIMDCQSSEALESLMGDYSSRSLHRMVKSTFLSESLLDEIGALYLSLGASIDYEEYLLCKEELADIEGMFNSMDSDKQHNRAIQKFDKERSRKTTAKESLTSNYKNLKERIQAVVDDGDIPEEQKEVYHQLRQVQRGKPLYNTAMVLLSSDGKGLSVFAPKGLTINQNEHVVVCDHGPDDQPGSVKTVTADTAQILTSVTVHGLPKIFTPQDTAMADNGDYYTADVDNKCIVVSDAKSRVKKEIAMGKLEHPTGVFVDKDRNVFIADYNAQCVIKLNGNEDIISSRDLSQPFSLTMNSKNQLIVSCQGDENCIYVLDSNLEILNNFGSDHLELPMGSYS